MKRKHKNEPNEPIGERTRPFYEQILWYAEPKPKPLAFMIYLQMRYRLVTSSKTDPIFWEALNFGDLIVRATPEDLKKEMFLPHVPLKRFRDAMDDLRERGWIRPWSLNNRELWILGKNWRPYAVDSLPESDAIPPGPLKETTT